MPKSMHQRGTKPAFLIVDMSLDLDIGFDSQAGRKRVNEDFAGMQLPGPGEGAHGAIAAIADGVSTGGFGAEAAQTSVTSVVRDYYGTPAAWDSTVALDRVIAAQNAWLAGTNRRRAPASGLTTLTVLVLRGHGWSLAHVGDTRAYLVRGGRVTLLTHDHAVAQHDFRHQLTRAVGAEERVVVDYTQGDLLVGDLFVLLTDGVHGALSERHLAALLHGSTAATKGVAGAQAFSQALTAAALEAGSPDNATALVVRVRGLQEDTLNDQRRRAATLPVPPRLAVGEAIDGWLVDAVLADNGINAVYKIRSEEWDQTGAGGQKDPDSAATAPRALVMKALLPARAHDPEERAQLAHEAWLARRLATSAAAPHLVALHEPHEMPGHEPSAFYLLYDWHTGDTLAQVLERGQPPAVSHVLQWAVQAARALAGLHRQGVVHRDVKPANLHLGADGVLRLLDLGVALSGHEPEAMRRLHAGTPSYINPEQWGYRFGASSGQHAHEAQPADAGSDLFALGVVLYQLLARGKLPYGDVLPYQLGRYWRDPVPPSRHNPEVPIWLDHIVQKAVARDARERFETAEEFMLALERGASRPLTAPPATPLLQRDPTQWWKLLLGVSLLFNLLLMYWLLALPR